MACAALTYFEQFPDLENREACLILLVRTLHAEVVANLKRAIEQRETNTLVRSSGPASNCMRDLICDRAMLGENLDAAIDYFRAKITSQDDPMAATLSAQVLVGLLVRHERYREAMQISMEHLTGIAPDQLACPTSVSALPTRRGFRTAEGVSAHARRLTKFRGRRNTELTVTSNL